MARGGPTECSRWRRAQETNCVELVSLKEVEVPADAVLVQAARWTIERLRPEPIDTLDGEELAIGVYLASARLELEHASATRSARTLRVRDYVHEDPDENDDAKDDLPPPLSKRRRPALLGAGIPRPGSRHGLFGLLVLPRLLGERAVYRLLSGWLRRGRRLW